MDVLNVVIGVLLEKFFTSKTSRFSFNYQLCLCISNAYVDTLFHFGWEFHRGDLVEVATRIGSAASSKHLFGCYESYKDLFQYIAHRNLDSNELLYCLSCFNAEIARRPAITAFLTRQEAMFDGYLRKINALPSSTSNTALINTNEAARLLPATTSLQNEISNAMHLFKERFLNQLTVQYISQNCSQYKLYDFYDYSDSLYVYSYDAKENKYCQVSTKRILPIHKKGLNIEADFTPNIYVFSVGLLSVKLEWRVN